ncbi:acylneuraminate cytidylyltransferase family protein [Pseudodesulfovibrio sp.]|uniref:acylneuraminate cytidylyltransferase family protein n=1 Tax=Pseudodesulfovibrio sp. TaxID=2035812 RepID=UPI002613C0D0|nr:acylneuraminate cytidylyltransferase family protein [Pseudodesulfovibrio sp.]MDD3312412.1 acylneuraminate cytidylyltransferase family protein [Pseudodesulfovibrio sp.]
MKPEVLALIPARGGSKGIPRKNIQPLCGVPLIAYSIDVALRARNVTRVIVSTDDPEIAEVARSYGAEVPFLRPKAIAGDGAAIGDAFAHAAGELRRAGYVPAYTATLYPTSPFRSVELVEHLVDVGLERNCRITTVKALDLASWSAAVCADGAYRRVEASPGQAALLAYRSYGVFSGMGVGNAGRTYLHELRDPASFIDIDAPEDLRLAEQILAWGLFPLRRPEEQRPERREAI